MMLTVTEPTVEVFQYNLEGNKEKSGIHKQMEKLVDFITVIVFSNIFVLLLLSALSPATVLGFYNGGRWGDIISMAGQISFYSQ